jgi:hypothetical protein
MNRWSWIVTQQNFKEVKMQLLYSHLQEQMKEIHTNYMAILHSDQDLNWGSREYYKNRLLSIKGMRDKRITTEVSDVLPLSTLTSSHYCIQR